MHPAYFETHFSATLSGVAWPERFSIITAYATTGEEWPIEKNLSANNLLASELKATGKWMHSIRAYSPKTGHEEPSCAVDMPWQEACDIGQRYHQDAIYWVQNDRLWVTLCDERRALVEVGSFSDRLHLENDPAG